MDMGLKDKVVLITGGGGGIARGIERAFATEGAKFILTDLFSRTDRWKRRCVRRSKRAPSTSAGASTS